MKRLFVLTIFMMSFSGLSQAAQLKGKSLSGARYKAELALKSHSPIQGKVKFRAGKKAVFTAYDGTEVDLRVRPICAATREENLDGCWPNLMVDVDDGSARTGELRIQK
jgi:hypothetical protein